MVNCHSKKRLLFCILAAIMLFSMAGCAAKEEGSINWQEVQTMTEEQYTVVRVDDSFLRTGEQLSETVYCNGRVYFFREQIIDSMRLNPEYYSVGCMDVETGETRILYEAPKYIVLQDIIAAEDKVYWVEIDFGEESEWKIAYYDMKEENLGVVREGVMGEDTYAEPVLTLSGRYILWDEAKPDGPITSFQYSLDDGSLQKWNLLELNFYNPYIGNRVYKGEPVYLSGEEGSYEIRSREKIFHRIEVETVGAYYISEQGILWEEGEVNSKAWFVRMRNDEVIGEAQMLPFQAVSSAELYGEWITLVNKGNQRNYYVLNINTGEQYRVPVEGFYAPRCSADGTIYFKGFDGSVLLLNLPFEFFGSVMCLQPLIACEGV